MIKKETEEKLSTFLAGCFAYYLPEFYSLIHWLRKNDKKFAYEIYKKTFYKDKDIKWEELEDENINTKIK